MADSNQDLKRKRFLGVIEVANEVMSDFEFDRDVMDNFKKYEIHDFDAKESQIKLSLILDGAGVDETANSIFASKLREALEKRYPDRRYKVQPNRYEHDRDEEQREPYSYRTIVSRLDLV